MTMNMPLRRGNANTNNNNSKVTLFQFLVINLLLNNSVSSTNPSTLTERSPKAELDLHISTPNFGACLDDKGQVKCSIGPFNCPSNTIYLKPSEIDTTTQCHSPHQVETGRCASSSSMDIESRGKDVCTAFPTSCKASLYTDTDDTCNIVEDQSTHSNTLTHYPSCREKASSDHTIPSRCVLSQDECMQGREDFLTIGDLSHIHQPCSCHDVPTGICHLSSSSTAITAATSFCAVAKYDCPTGYTFMTALELITMVDPPRICRLCEEENMGDFDSNEQGELLEKDDHIDDLNFAYMTSIDPMIKDTYNNVIYNDKYDDGFGSGYHNSRSNVDDDFPIGLVLGGSIGGAFVLISAAVFMYVRRDTVPVVHSTSTVRTELIIPEGMFT